MYAQIISGQPVAITSSVVVGDLSLPIATFEKWSDDERASVGIHLIVDDVIPAGKRQVGSMLENDNGAILRRWVLEDIPAPPVPESISDRQFAQVLALQSLITQEEALAWVRTGDVPATLQTLVDEIEDTNVRFNAQMLLAGATVFERHHPMTEQLAAGLGMEPAAIDELWRQAAEL